MSRIMMWIHAMGGAGAVANAGTACQQRRDQITGVEARLARIPAVAVRVRDAA
jgi:hypothetical protein